MVNTHPGLLCTRRQHYYMVKLLAKYQVSSFSRDTNFLGMAGIQTEMETYNVPNPTVPKEFQTKQYIRHGK